MRHFTLMRQDRRFVCVVLAIAIVGIAGCQSAEKGKMAKAQQILTDSMAADAAHAQYGLRVIGNSSAPATEALITEYLGAVNPETATAAAEAAGDRRLASGTEALKTLFSTKVGAPQIEAARALAKMGDAGALQWLGDQAAGAKGQPSPRVIEALIDVGAYETAREALQKALDSESQSDRDAAYILLADVGEPWAREMVLAGLKKEHGEGRAEAIRALGRVGEAPDAYEIQRFINTLGLVYATIEALGELGDESAVPELKKMAERPEKLVKVYAAAALWKLGKATEAEKIVDPLLQDEDVAIRMELANQLAGIPGASGRLAFLAQDDPDGHVRTAAVRGLREGDAAAAVPILLECAADPDYQVAVVAIDGLSAGADMAAVETVEPFLQSENPYIAISAANALIEILTRAERAPQS